MTQPNIFDYETRRFGFITDLQVISDKLASLLASLDLECPLSEDLWSAKNRIDAAIAAISRK